MGNSLGIGALLGPTDTDYGWQKKNKKTRSALSLGMIHGGQKKKKNMPVYWQTNTL